MSDLAVGAPQITDSPPQERWDELQVFSASTPRARDELDERVNAWLRANHGRVRAVESVVLQSSDRAHHCLSVVLFLQRSVPRGG